MLFTVYTNIIGMSETLVWNQQYSLWEISQTLEASGQGSSASNTSGKFKLKKGEIFKVWHISYNMFLGFFSVSSFLSYY